jgi:hypothetical protein
MTPTKECHVYYGKIIYIFQYYHQYHTQIRPLEIIWIIQHNKLSTYQVFRSPTHKYLWKSFNLIISKLNFLPQVILQWLYRWNVLHQSWNLHQCNNQCNIPSSSQLKPLLPKLHTIWYLHPAGGIITLSEGTPLDVSLSPKLLLRGRLTSFFRPWCWWQ